MQYNFDWDPHKEQQNIQKHNLSFRLAATIFHDPHQLSVFDEDHSDDEDRWVTMGIDGTGVLRIVVHTFEQLDEDVAYIRLISARSASKAEIDVYNSGIL